jgi:hypothetical protein
MHSECKDLKREIVDSYAHTLLARGLATQAIQQITYIGHAHMIAHSATL